MFRGNLQQSAQSILVYLQYILSIDVLKIIDKLVSSFLDNFLLKNVQFIRTRLSSNLEFTVAVSAALKHAFYFTQNHLIKIAY